MAGNAANGRQRGRLEMYASRLRAMATKQWQREMENEYSMAGDDADADLNGLADDAAQDGVMRVCGCCGELRMVSRGNENLCGQCARTVEKLTAKRYAPRPDDSEQFRRAFKFMASRRAAR